MKVKEIMIKDVVSLSPEATAQEALDLLEKMRISGLPVIGKGRKLMGMFTEKDALSYLLPSYIEKVGNFVYEADPKATKKKFQELGNIKVSQLMRKDVETTAENATLCEVARIMLVKKARRLPVLDNSGKVIGMIARCDILKAFKKMARSCK